MTVSSQSAYRFPKNRSLSAYFSRLRQEVLPWISRAFSCKTYLHIFNQVRKVLEDMSDKEYKNTRDVNEVLSLKFHILQYIIKVSYLWEPSNGLSLRIKRFYIDYTAMFLHLSLHISRTTNEQNFHAITYCL